MSKKTLHSVNIPLLFMKEGDMFVCFPPVFDLVAHGDSFEDALESFEKTFQLFAEEITKMGTWPKVLEEYGWQKVEWHYSPPAMIGQMIKTLPLPVAILWPIFAPSIIKNLRNSYFMWDALLCDKKEITRYIDVLT